MDQGKSSHLQWVITDLATASKLVLVKILIEALPLSPWDLMFFSGNCYLPEHLQLKEHTGRACRSRHVHPSLETKEGRDGQSRKETGYLVTVGVGVPLGD